MVETTYYKSKARNLAILLTLLFVGTILTILLLIILRTPIPPYPEGGGGTGNGIELNLGFSDAGMGNNPQELSMAEKEVPKPETQAKDNEELLKQDVEDAPSINEKIDKKAKKDVKKDVTPIKKETKREPVKREPVINTAALYKPSSKNNQSSEGDKNVPGDQGNPSGNLAKNAFGKGGQGGSGGGSGGGTGTGTGTGVGVGIISNVNNRIPTSLPLPQYTQQVEGDVVVDLTLDSEGKVIQAEPGKKGTTTTDSNLWEEAKRAAKQSHFDGKPGAMPQKVTIRYRFRLQ